MSAILALHTVLLHKFVFSLSALCSHFTKNVFTTPPSLYYTHTQMQVDIHVHVSYEHTCHIRYYVSAYGTYTWFTLRNYNLDSSIYPSSNTCIYLQFMRTCMYVQGNAIVSQFQWYISIVTLESEHIMHTCSLNAHMVVMADAPLHRQRKQAHGASENIRRKI